MLNWLTGLFDHVGGNAGDWPPCHPDINPATGLPMVGGAAGFDVAGNPFGYDVHRWHNAPRTGASSAGDRFEIDRSGPTVLDAWSQSGLSDWAH